MHHQLEKQIKQVLQVKIILISQIRLDQTILFQLRIMPAILMFLNGNLNKNHKLIQQIAAIIHYRIEMKQYIKNCWQKILTEKEVKNGRKGYLLVNIKIDF